MTEPWRDPENYKSGPTVKCSGCNTFCRLAHWGPWCRDCNIERIERLTATLEGLASGK